MSLPRTTGVLAGAGYWRRCCCQCNHTSKPRVIKQIVKRIASDGHHRDANCLRTLAYDYDPHAGCREVRSEAKTPDHHPEERP